MIEKEGGREGRQCFVHIYNRERRRERGMEGDREAIFNIYKLLCTHSSIIKRQGGRREGEREGF